MGFCLWKQFKVCAKSQCLWKQFRITEGFFHNSKSLIPKAVQLRAMSLKL